MTVCHGSSAVSSTFVFFQRAASFKLGLGADFADFPDVTQRLSSQVCTRHATAATHLPCMPALPGTALH